MTLIYKDLRKYNPTWYVKELDHATTKIPQSHLSQSGI